MPQRDDLVQTKEFFWDHLVFVSSNSIFLPSLRSYLAAECLRSVRRQVKVNAGITDTGIVS